MTLKDLDNLSEQKKENYFKNTFNSNPMEYWSRDKLEKYIQEKNKDFID